MSDEIDIIIFSKDRAMQLDLFIRSFNEMVVNSEQYILKILYTYSNEEYRLGYEKLMNKNYINVKFIKEKKFKEDLLNLIENKKYIVFFVDDIIFKNKFNFDDNQKIVFDSDLSILCRSLRLHPKLNYCYAAQIPMRKPVFENNGIFVYKGMDGDYGYPFSVDGHIFRTNDLITYIRKFDYKNPNSFEGELTHIKSFANKMICYENSIVINNPINIVQTNNPNRCGNISAEYLNKKYLEGKTIKLTPFIGIESSTVHLEMPIELE